MTNPNTVHVPQWDLPDRLRKALREQDISVASMAEYLGLNPATVSRYVNGKADVPRQTVRLWALRCGVPYEWLKDGETPTAPDGGDGGGLCANRDSNPEPAVKAA